MDPELVKRSLNYHGQQMTRIWGVERGNKPLQGFNVKDLDYHEYQKRAKELAMQDRTKRVKIQHFIVEKAERLFKPAEPSPNVIITPEEQEAIVNLPPLESLLNVSAEDKSNSLQDFLKVGDIVVGHVLWHHHATLGVKVLALDGGKKRDLSDLNIKGFVSESNVPPHEGNERAYHLNDVLRMEVVSNFRSKLHLGLKGVHAPPHVLAHYPLGKIDAKLIDVDKKLPSYLAYDTKRRKGWTFDDAFEDSPEWENPESMSILAKSLGIVSTGSLKETYTHMMGLSAISPLDMAPNLRKIQAVKWAHKHVAEGIAYFKKGNETEAFQCLNKALQIDPCNVEGSVARGALYANHANFDKAVEDFMTALNENPFHANAQKYLAETLCAQGKQHEDDKENDEALLSYQHCLAIMPRHSEAREAMTALVAYLKWQNSHFEVQPLSPTDPFQVIHDRVYQPENVEAIDADLNRTWSPDVEIIREISPKPKERSLSPFSKKMAMLESFDQETRSSGVIENVSAVSEQILRSPPVSQAVEQQAEGLKVREKGNPNLLPSTEVIAETPLNVPPPSFSLPPPFVHGVPTVQPGVFGAGLPHMHGDFQTQPPALPGSLVNPFFNVGNTSQPPPVFPTQVPHPVPVGLPAQMMLQPPSQETKLASNAYDEQVRLFLEKIEGKKGDKNRGYKEEKRYREYSRERTDRKEKKKKKKYRSESESSDSEEIVKKKKKKKHSYSPKVTPTYEKEVKILDKPNPKGLLPELDDFPNIDDLQSKLSNYYQKISSKEDKREVPVEKRIIMRNLRERKSSFDSSSSSEEEATSRIKERKMKEDVEIISESEKKGVDREIKKDEYAVDVDSYFSSLNRVNKKLREGIQINLAVKKNQEVEKRSKNLWLPNRDEPTCSSGIDVPQPRRRSRSREEADKRRARDERGRSRTREERGRSKTREERDIRQSKVNVSESRRSSLKTDRSNWRRSRSRGRSRSREHRGRHESRSGYNRGRKSSERSRRSEERKIERSSDRNEPPRNARGTRSPFPAASYSVVYDPAFGNYKRVFQKDEPQSSRPIGDRFHWSKSATEKGKESPGKNRGLDGEKSQIDMFAPEEKDWK
ncbi:tetratricopeptide repeat protein 14 homolog isoform X2 [Artemia franciscana]|uniref:tetratricopeptide repeat protein 14 homolog isoform X2 n=1 Tax=Artemia franciscana TaxID=6661 RepID=UPI0032DA3E44